MFILHGTFQAFILSAECRLKSTAMFVWRWTFNCFSILNKVHPYLWMELLVSSQVSFDMVNFPWVRSRSTMIFVSNYSYCLNHKASFVWFFVLNSKHLTDYLKFNLSVSVTRKHAQCEWECFLFVVLSPIPKKDIQIVHKEVTSSQEEILV